MKPELADALAAPLAEITGTQPLEVVLVVQYVTPEDAPDPDEVVE